MLIYAAIFAVAYGGPYAILAALTYALITSARAKSRLPRLPHPGRPRPSPPRDPQSRP